MTQKEFEKYEVLWRADVLRWRKSHRPSATRRCRICRDLHDALEFPELKGVCQDCWHKVQDWLRERGISLVQKEGERE